MSKKKGALELAMIQQKQRAADTCVAWCRRMKRRTIPDMALFILNMAVEKYRLKADINENVEFLNGIIERHDKFEEAHDKILKKMQDEDKKELAKRPKRSHKPKASTKKIKK